MTEGDTVAAADQRRLIALARDGDPRAQEEIMGLIRSFSRHVCRGFEAGGRAEPGWEDVAQEAGIRFFSQGLQRYRDGWPEKPYIYAFVKRAFLQTLRTVRRRKLREASADPPAPGLGNPEAGTRLYRILARLPETCRELLQRLYFDGASYAELAEEFGLRESSVRARTTRCLRSARKLLA